MRKPKYSDVERTDFNNGICNLFPLYIFVYDKELERNGVEMIYRIRILERVENQKKNTKIKNEFLLTKRKS